MSQEKLVCPSCGAPITSFDEKVCPFCHEPLPAPLAAEATRPVGQRNIQFWMLGIPMLCCCAPVGTLWIMGMAPWSRRTKWVVGGLLGLLSAYQLYATIHFWGFCKPSCSTAFLLGWPF